VGAPDDLERVRIEARGFAFDALAAGPADGELVLLLHGFPQTSWAYRAILPALAGAGYRALAPDQRGYSPGARPADVEAYSRPELVADVLAFADWAGAERFHLVGHDWGAAIAWQVAGRYADRLLSLTSLSVPHPGAMLQSVQPDSGSDQRERSSYIAMFREEGSEQGMLANDRVGLRLIYVGAGLTEDESAPYLEQMGHEDALRSALNWYRAASLLDIEGLGPVAVPVLFVASTADPAISLDSCDRCGSMVEGPYRYEVLEGVSHWIPEQAADQVIPLLLDHLAAASPR
jgi:pimeloyl-ACP methyl ester carboxylesterase